MDIQARLVSEKLNVLEDTMKRWKAIYALYVNLKFFVLLLISVLGTSTRSLNSHVLNSSPKKFGT